MTEAARVDDQEHRRVRMTREQRRERFLDVAAELIVESGLESVTMERVAARSGVSKALGYAYFENSDALVAALFDREMASYDRAIAVATADATTFEERIRGAVVAMFDMVAERGHLFGTLLNGQSPPESTVGRKRRRRKATAEDFIGSLIAQEYGVSEKDAVTIAAMWIAAATGAIDSWVAGRGSRRELTDLYVKLVVGGVHRVAGR